MFELITASYAAEGYNLRDDWYGSSVRNVDSRRRRLSEDALLSGIEATEFLQGITLLHTHERKRAESFYARRELPYSTQLVPLSAVLSRLGETWLEPKVYDKLTQWFWCGVLGELYGGAVETRIANDYEQLLEWIDDDDRVPRTVLDASFQPDRFNTLRSRLSAAYKGISVLVLRDGAKDWLWKAGIQELDVDEVSLDIHHVFPRAWCKSMQIPKDTCDCILNKTPLSYRANRKIGGDSPSVYLPRIQNEKQVQLTDGQMDQLLASHAIDPTLLRRDDFDGFIRDRRQKLSDLVGAVMGKEVSQIPDGGEYVENGELEFVGN